MRRFLLTTGAASLVMLTACSQLEPVSRAFADTGDTRVRLLSDAETLQSVQQPAQQTSAEETSAAAGSTKTDITDTQRATRRDPGQED